MTRWLPPTIVLILVTGCLVVIGDERTHTLALFSPGYGLDIQEGPAPGAPSVGRVYLYADETTHTRS